MPGAPDDTRLDGRRALVTGAGVGIGRAIAVRLADRGASVALHHHGHAADAEATVAAITASGGTAVSLAADLSDLSAGADLVARATAALDGLDILVNNAGRTVEGPFDEVDAGRVRCAGPAQRGGRLLRVGGGAGGAAGLGPRRDREHDLGPRRAGRQRLRALLRDEGRDHRDDAHPGHGAGTGPDPGAGRRARARGGPALLRGGPGLFHGARRPGRADRPGRPARGRGRAGGVPRLGRGLVDDRDRGLDRWRHDRAARPRRPAPGGDPARTSPRAAPPRTGCSRSRSAR